MIKKFVFLISLIVQLPCFASETALMTTYDLPHNGVSNLNLRNNTDAPVTVSGVYLFGVAWIEPGENCQNAINPGQNSTQNQFMAGTLIAPIRVAAKQSVPIGQNYLYNMLYNFFYWYRSISATPPCALPGCTWPGDAPVNYCFQLGAVSPNSAYTSSSYPSNAPPFSWATSSSIDSYNYDLIPYNPLVPNDQNRVYTWIGPFTCSDQTLTCATAVPQSQSFQP